MYRYIYMRNYKYLCNKWAFKILKVKVIALEADIDQVQQKLTVV